MITSSVSSASKSGADIAGHDSTNRNTVNPTIPVNCFILFKMKKLNELTAIDDRFADLNILHGDARRIRNRDLLVRFPAGRIACNNIA